jgi:hypothetical protein
MAFCPKCKGDMAATAIVCPHCGYDFPDPDSTSTGQRKGFAYSPLADLALLVSMIAAVLGACGAVLATIVALFHGQLIYGLFVGPIALLLQLGMLVVFLRVQQ